MMEMDTGETSTSAGPTLGLVGSSGNVETFQKEEEPDAGPCLVAVSSVDCDHEKVAEDLNEKAPEDVNEAGPSEPSKRPRLTTTLLIFKKPSTESEDYVIGNPQVVDSEEDEDGERHHKKKKKKKKSKERVLSMSRSYAQQLLEIQKSLSKLTSKYQPSPYEEIDRRRRTQSASFLPISDSSAFALKSPPLSAPVHAHPPFFPGYKGKSSLLSRRRQFSLGSNADGKRRLTTRRKRWESEEMRGSGLTTPTSESAKKNHLSENNVWTPMDDYRLLVNITQTKGNLEHVFAGTKFSCHYTFDEVAHRWETLLYDEKAGTLSQTAINNLHPLVKARIQSEALFSDEEESLLRTIKTSPGQTPDINNFGKLLQENLDVFYNRTAKKLLMHWLDMKNFHLLEGQDVHDYKDPFNLFELQDNAYVAALPDMSVYHELKTESKLVKRQIRQLEEEVESWHCMQELVVSDGTDLHSIFSTSEFDDQTLAILRGKQVRYCMRSKEILLGRNSTNNKVDADLTLEGASGKVSRRQAVIQMRDFGEFYIINQGRHSIFVDNIHVPYGAMAKMSDGCVIQITDIKLIFKVNEKLLRNEISNEIKKEVLNARYKSLVDPYSTPTYSPVSLKSPSLLNDPFAIPSTPRFATPSPKKRGATSASSSPVLGLSGSPRVRSNSGRSVGSPSIGIPNYSPLLPFSTSDLTIRSTSQPSPFALEPGSRVAKSFVANLPPLNDNDVFKKPAPVSFVRPPVLKSPTSTKVPLPIPSTSTSAASAFVTVPGNGALELLSATASTHRPQESQMQTMQLGSSDESFVATITTDTSNVNLLAPMPPNTNGQLMDSLKLGLSSDVTATYMTTDPTTQVSESSNPETKPRIDNPPEEPKHIPTPSLGLVRHDNS